MSRVFDALRRASPNLITYPEPTGDTADCLSQIMATVNGEAPVLEEAPRFQLPQAEEARLVAWNNPNCLAAENLRVLTARLREARQRRSLKTLLITSAICGEGKTVTSANLAITLALHGEKVLLIDGDLHQAALSRIFGISDERGLATWHKTSQPASGLLKSAEGLPLWFLPAGVCSQQPLHLIQSEQTAELLKQFCDWFSWIVIDSPPLVPLADSRTWAAISDALLLVTRQGFTPKKAFMKGLATLDRSKLFAVVINEATATEERYYRAYHLGKAASTTAGK